MGALVATSPTVHHKFSLCIYMKHHIAISGTGRAGTTFLMQLFTELGLNTGFAKTSINNLPTQSYGGLERSIYDPNAGYIVKDPHICDYMADIVRNEAITIDHLIVPIRALNHAAESRRRVQALGCADGSLWGTNSMQEGAQEQVLANKLYGLLLAAAGAHIPVTLLQFPRLALDADYLFTKLAFMLEATISQKDFAETFALVADSSKIHLTD